MPSPAQINALWSIVLMHVADSTQSSVLVAKCGRPGFFARVTALTVEA